MTGGECSQSLFWGCLKESLEDIWLRTGCPFALKCRKSAAEKKGEVEKAEEKNKVG